MKLQRRTECAHPAVGDPRGEGRLLPGSPRNEWRKEFEVTLTYEICRRKVVTRSMWHLKLGVKGFTENCRKGKFPEMAGGLGMRRMMENRQTKGSREYLVVLPLAIRRLSVCIQPLASISFRKTATSCKWFISPSWCLL